jgi:hypothetical protein
MSLNRIGPLVGLRHSIIVTGTIGAAFFVGTVAVHGEGASVRDIRDREFTVVSDDGEIRRLLARAHSRQVSVLKDLHTCRGEGVIEQWSLEPEIVSKGEVLKVSEGDSLPNGVTDADDKKSTRIVGPFIVRRKSKTQFVWSGDMRSLRSTFERIPPTIFESVNGDRRFAVIENLSIRNLVRPDGFYYFRPDIRAGEFKGYPPSLAGSGPARYVQRLPVEQAKERSDFSTAFDPSTMLLIGGMRIDAFSEQYIEFLDALPGRLELSKRSDESLVVTMSYASGANREPDLLVDVLLDSTFDFVPTRASFTNGDGVVTESLTWSYVGDHSLRFPSAFEREKSDAKGHKIEGRSVRLSNLIINESATDSDFSLASIELADGERIIDRVEKTVNFVKDGDVSPVRPSKWTVTKWCLVIANVTALLGVLGVLFARLRRRIVGGRAYG